MTKNLKYFLFFIIIFFNNTTFAENIHIKSHDQEKIIQKLRIKLGKLDQTYANAKILPTSSPEFYLVVNDKGENIYITKSGKNLIFGNIFRNVNNKTLVDIKNEIVDKHRASILNQLDESNFIKFTDTKHPKLKLFVFSDVTCPYCKKLHENLDKILKAGIEVYYIPYPRNGMNDTLAVNALKKIICSKNPQKQYDEGFENTKKYVFSVKQSEIQCKKSHLIKDFYKLGEILGIQGTPAIYLPDGAHIKGFSSLKNFYDQLQFDFMNYKVMQKEESSSK